MSADRLRAAASKLRGVAEAATPGRWFHCYTASNRHWVEGPGDYNGYDETLATGTSGEDATYIALMSPPVALTLADWLDWFADAGEKGVIIGASPASKVADAILGATR